VAEAAAVAARRSAVAGTAAAEVVAHGLAELVALALEAVARALAALAAAAHVGTVAAHAVAAHVPALAAEHCPTGSAVPSAHVAAVVALTGRHRTTAKARLTLRGLSNAIEAHVRSRDGVNSQSSGHTRSCHMR
jgi:hypothetical protein